MSTLHISDELDLPIEAATGRFVAIGKSGSGKTNAGVVLAEELLASGVTTAILDVLGNMHGLRAAGDGPGLPIAILGGLNGDIPLRADRGAVVADLVASGVSAVMDLSQLTREDAQRFAAEFFARLVPAVRASQRNVHVVVEEAETYAPERVSGKAHNASRAATTVFARTARNVGIGWTFSTQRPQLLAKDVIDSSTAFIAMKMTGDLAQEAIGAEVRSRAGKTLAAEIIEDLPKLRRGEAWLVPDPDWLGDDREAEPQKFKFRWRHTFDSARPPKVGERREEPRAIADVDLDALRAAMADDEPSEAERAEPKTSAVRVERVEVPVLLRLEIEDLRAISVRLGEILRAFGESGNAMAETVDKLADRLHIGLNGYEVAPVAPEQGVAQDGDRTGSTVQTADGNARPEASAGVLGRSPKASSPSPATIGDAKLGIGPMKILAALASTRQGKATRVQLAFLSGFAVGGGSYRTYLSALRVAGTIESEGDIVAITAVGLSAIGGRPKRATSTRDVVAMFRAKLGTGPGRMFDALLAAWPNSLSREQIAEQSGYEVAGGSFRTYLSALSAAQLTEKRGNTVRLVDELFPTGKP